jgi:hypothetical protein
VAAALVVVGAVARPEASRATLDDTTNVYDRHGRYVTSLIGHEYGLNCWVDYRSKAGTIGIQGQGFYGGIVPLNRSRGKWGVWFGRHVIGLVVQRSKRRADAFDVAHYTDAGWKRYQPPRLTGYSIGPAIPGAAGAYVAMGSCN